MTIDTKLQLLKQTLTDSIRNIITQTNEQIDMIGNAYGFLVDNDHYDCSTAKLSLSTFQEKILKSLDAIL